MSVNQGSSSKRKSPPPSSLPKGDKEPGLNPPIPLYDPALLDRAEESEAEGKWFSDVEFKIRIDPSESATKDNLTTKRFKQVTNLVGEGNVVVTIYRQMCIDYFEPDGRMDIRGAGHRLMSFMRVTSGQAREQFNQVLAHVREEYTDKVEKSVPDEAVKLRAGNLRDFSSSKLNIACCIQRRTSRSSSMRTTPGSPRRRSRISWA